MMDERTTQVRNKIMSEMAMLMYLFVAAAFAVKVLLMGKGIRDCVVEYVILILAPLYQYVRARQLKFSLYRPGYGSQQHRRQDCNIVSGAILSPWQWAHWYSSWFSGEPRKQEPWMPKRRSRGC